MYAIIKEGGLQYPVEVNRYISVNRVHVMVGSELEIDKVLFIKDDNNEIKIGQPYVENAKVVCEVLEHYRDKKIIVFKKKRRKKYRVKRGHRQDKSKLMIKSIQF